ncbi:hypothetical protein PIROE2DRAFT_16913 [Piromyces sp. E2]|nr:hypothetical protein PIROE2DRAFT_16913 [Piromyces sp. E2]|eukprot:OUM57943.1 hypothetical protein PIROE2DRAFT_16913 [Piromyces sp. E2]
MYSDFKLIKQIVENFDNYFVSVSVLEYLGMNLDKLYEAKILKEAGRLEMILLISHYAKICNNSNSTTSPFVASNFSAVINDFYYQKSNVFNFYTN